MPCIEGDLDALFSASDFAEAEGSVVYNGVSFTGIFDDEDIEVDQGDGVVIAHQAVLMTATSNVPGIRDNDDITINGLAWTVRFKMDDGTGQTDIYLEKNH